LLSAVFVYAGALKLADPVAFGAVIAGYGLLPRALVGPVALGLPLAEVVAGIGLALDRRISLGAILVLVLLFMGVLAYGIGLGLDVDCGCYGPGDPQGEAFQGLRIALARDTALLAMILYMLWWRRMARAGSQE